MLPSEVEILTYIEKNGRLNGYARNSADVLGEYIVIIFNSLRKRGLISGNGWTGFRLTEKGREYVRRRSIYERSRVREAISSVL